MSIFRLFGRITLLTLNNNTSDRIIVLQAGRVAEFDTPAVLLENKESQFYSLVKEAGLLQGTPSG